MAFHEIQFPSGISYGAHGGPGFNTAIIEKDSGQEERVQRWSPQGRRNYDVSHGLKSPLDCSTLLDFYMVRAGAAHGFRYKDWSDYATTPSHTLASSLSEAVSTTDEVLGVGDGTTTTFQLVTTYVSSTTVTRSITKPVLGTVKIAVAGVTKVEGVDFSVSYTTGVVTFNVAPVLAAVVTGGCQFDTPVRFGKPIDDQLPLTIEAFELTSIPAIVLVELLDESEANEDFWAGGGKEFGAIAANQSLTLGDGRALGFLPTISNVKLFMPVTTQIPGGGPHFVLVNHDVALSMLVRTSGDAAVATLAPLTALTMWLTKDISGNRKWIAA